MTREEAIREAWRQGFLGWKLFSDQREVYDAIWAFLKNPETQYEQFYLDIARQYGKTFVGLGISTEVAIRKPGARILYTAESRASLWQYVRPNMDTLLADCPRALLPRWNTVDNSYHFGNGSQIHLVGVNNGHENDARGPKADLIVNEEAGFVDRLQYLMESIELPMLTTTGGRVVNISTPPESPAHEAAAIKAKCLARGNYLKRTIDDNRHMTAKAKAKLIEEMGGAESTRARRELWCEWVVEAERAIVPEYTAAADKEIVKPVPAIGWNHALIAMDVGFEDLHAILYGYWDFARAKLCVQAEDILHRATTDRIAYAIKTTESRLWYRDGPKPTAKRPVEPTRWTDVDPRLIADMAEGHRLSMLATAKDDLEAQVNALRMLVKERKVEIDPSCVVLRQTLLVGVWNKQRTQFERATGVGHADAVAALIYMLRNANRWDDPRPALPEGVSSETHQIPRRGLDGRSEQAKALAAAFVRRR